MRPSTLLVAAALGLAAGLPPAAAGTFRPEQTVPPNSVPTSMNYQGRLEKDGFPVSGTRTMRFKLYDSDTAGLLLWDSMDKSISLTAGLFSQTLDIPFTALSGPAQKYIEISIDGITLAPRDPLRSVPYAKVAQSVEGTIDVSSAGFTLTTPVNGSALSVSSGQGNVGIGTNIPGARLHVSSGTGETGPLVIISTGTSSVYSTVASIDGNGRVLANSFVGDGTGLINVVRQSGDTMTGGLVVTPNSFSVGGTSLFVEPAAGKVGFGTASPAATLSVAGDSSFTQPATFKSSVTVAGSATVTSTLTVNGTAFSVGGTRLVLPAAGNVGVGTALPQATLEVNGNAQFGSAAAKSTFSATGALTMANNTNITLSGTGLVTGLAAPAGVTDATNKNYVDSQLLSGGGPWTQSGAQIFQTTPANTVVMQSSATVLGTAFSVGVTRLVVDAATGNTGVGTNAPASKLSVAGNSAFSGASSFASSVTVVNNNFSVGGTALAVTAGIVSMATPLAVASGGTGDATGLAPTATALAANGANCAAGFAPLGVDASGAVEGCYDVATQAELNTHAALTGTSAHGAATTNTASALVARDGSGNFAAGTITAALAGNANTATALAANGANCAANQFPKGVDAAGAAESCATLTDADVPDNITINLAATATALAANGANCAAGFAPLGVDASGAVEGCYDVATQAELNTHAALTGTSAHGAASANTFNALVSRDASGGFTASIINLTKIVTNTTAPVLTGCGGAGAAVTGTDTAGRVVIGAGGAATCQVNFNAVFSAVPTCVIGWSGAGTYTSAGTVGTLLITAAFSAADTMDYICIGH